MSNFLKELEREIRHNSRELEREEQLARLQAVAESYSGPDEVISSLEMERRIRREGTPEYIKTGIEGLDEIIHGFRKKQLVIISAPPKAGKTSFCLHLTNLLKDYNPLWIPLEQDIEEIVSVNVERGRPVPLFYAPEQNKYPALTDWIENKIVEAIAKYDTKIVFIDHLSFVRPSNTNEKERYVQVGRSVEMLREIGKRLAIPIVLVAHIRKSDPTDIPTVEDLYESGMIHQLADTVIMLWREAYKENKELHYSNNVLLSVQANRRHGTTGNVRFKYQNFTYLEDPMIVFRHENEKVKDPFKF